MNPTLSFKCLPYINSIQHGAIRGVYCLTRRLKSDDSDNNNKPKKNQLAIDKLNDLLKSMKKGDELKITANSTKHIELAQPRQMAKKANQQKIDELKESETLGKKLADAATSVAQSVGGDIKKTESELLNLLKIYSSEPNDSTIKKSKSSVQLDELLSGMKIDRSQPKTTSSKYENVNRAQRVRGLSGNSDNVDQRIKYNRKPKNNYIPVNLFSSEPLDILKISEVNQNLPTLSTWDRLYENSLQMAITHPSKNIYEQMIIWTEQGKLWKFPINNEQGMDDEKNIFFAEHVFLEPLIDEWCPKKGPIRHFMELVCIGLSKNPFLSVEEKRDHINWFRQYFYEKNQLLNEVGAFEIKSLPENVKEYYKPTIPDE